MPRPVTRSQIERQLSRILVHPLFQKSHRLGRFLRFVVEGAIAGRSNELKEYVIGLEVFGLAADYNPQENPIVRILAGRLRSKLAEYYLGAGLSDPVLIEIPRGSYVPRFVTRTTTSTVEAAHSPPSVLPHALCVGRDYELQQLSTSFEGMAAAGAMWNITGDAGIGKTTLASELLAEVRRGATAAWIGWGSGSERLAETDAFVPILECLHNLLKGPEAAEAADHTCDRSHLALAFAARVQPPAGLRIPTGFPREDAARNHRFPRKIVPNPSRDLVS